MVASHQVRAQMDRAMAQLTREEAALAGRLATLAEEAQAAATEEAAAVRTLAEIRLDAMARDEIDGRLTAAEAAAREVLATKRARLAEIEAEEARLAQQAIAAEGARMAAAEALETAMEALAAQVAQTQARLAEEPDWQAAEAHAAAARATAEAADAKAAQAEADRDEKAKAFEDDPLFTYLWQRGYGTADYQAMNIVRYGDGKVADLIGFRGAREAYYRLTEIPRRLRAHAARLAADAEAAEEARAEIERAGLAADGGGPLQAAIENAEAALDRSEAEAERVDAAAADLRAEAETLLDPERDPALARALDGMAAALGSESRDRLRAAAAETASAADDAVVERLEGLAATQSRISREIAEVRAARRDLGERIGEIERERRRFGRQGYGAPGGSFDNGEMIGQILGGVLAGALKSGALGDALSDGFRGGRIRIGTGGFGGGFGGPSGGGFGGSSGGGFRTGGGF